MGSHTKCDHLNTIKVCCRVIMNITTATCLLIVCVLPSVTGALAEAGEIIGIIRLGLGLVQYMNKVWEELCTGDCSLSINPSSQLDRQLLQQSRLITQKMDLLEESLASVQSSVSSLHRTLPTYVRYEIKLDRLEQIISNIWGTYNLLEFYQENRQTVERHTLEDFALSVTSHRAGSIMTQLRSLHSLVVPEAGLTSSTGILASLASRVKSGKHLCSMTQSPNQLLYNLYNIIALTEIKGYAMLQFSYMMLKIYDKGNFTAEGERARENFEEQAMKKMESMLMVLPDMPTDFLRCDPVKHKAGDTYLEVTKLLQGYIENEVDMNERNSCQSQCSTYTITESKSCYKDGFCAKQPACKGRIFDCQFYHADAWVCMSEDSDKRRYDWVEYEDGTLLGAKGTCNNKIKVDSWWRWVFWHCSYCLCKCEEINDDSDRYWSLVPAVADTANNMTVTGLRFIKRGRVIHPQIEQARALPEGGIDESTRKWVEPAETFSNDTKVLSDKNNTKIFMMSYEKRAMDMDTLHAPVGHVLTGIKLRDIGGHLNLEIQVTPVEFATAKLLSERSTWVANDNTPATDKPRSLVPIIMPDIPTKFEGYNKVDTDTDEYVMFDSSSAYKDVSQTTIPFIDAQPVAPQPASWLGGAGLYHKGRVGYGGFVGLKVLTYDFSRHIVPTTSTKPSLRYEFVKAENV